MSIVGTGASDGEKGQPARAALSVSETASTLGICEASVYRALKRGDLESVTLGGRRLIPASSIQKLLAPQAA
jgi:excisionase family DNA binding protein